MEWYEVAGIHRYDTPLLLVYKDRVIENIRRLVQMVNDPKQLRPHVKTNKMVEICRLMMQQGIGKFKCATIAEAEMLCNAGAKDVLLAYPVIGYKTERLIQLAKAFPDVELSCLIDNEVSAAELNARAGGENISLPVYIDVNVGMNRTGAALDKVADITAFTENASNLNLKGFHAYDGHIHDDDLKLRCKESREAILPLLEMKDALQNLHHKLYEIVACGSPTFACHLQENMQLSPGTFVFWDYNYKKHYPELPFEYAALVACRVISVSDDYNFCTDAGYKAMASEMQQPRMYFINKPDVTVNFQSEEHLSLRTPEPHGLKPGDVLYGVPMHICPTVALYDEAQAVIDNTIIAQWQIEARKRKIHF